MAGHESVHERPKHKWKDTDILNYFSVKDDFFENMDNEAGYDIEVFLSGLDNRNIVSVKRKNQKYLKKEMANKIFGMVYAKYSDRTDSVIIFNSITAYYTIRAVDYWNSLCIKYRLILKKDLYEQTGIKKLLCPET